MFSRAISMLRRNPAASAITAVAVAATLFVLLLPGVHRPDVTGSFLAVIALSLWGLLLDDRPYSLCQMFFLFCLIFMGVMPMGQYVTGFTGWGTLPCPARTYVTANVLTALSIALAIATAYRLPGLRRGAPVKEQPDAPALRLSYAWLALASLGATALVMWYYREEPIFLWRRLDDLPFHTMKSPMEILAVNYVLRSVPAMCLTVCLLGGKAPKWTIALTAVCALVAASPTAVPRNLTAVLWMPAAILLIPLLRRRKTLALLVIVMLATVFPLLNLTRVQFYNETSAFNGLDYDCYQNFALVVDNGIITHGRQLLGALLFFIPRSLWPAKPIGSGPELANDLHLSFVNISMPVFGEGYINFGAAGTVIFVLVFVLAFRRMDKAYRPGSRTFATLLYLLLLGDALFLLRGSMMQAFSALCSVILAAAAAWFPAVLLARKKQKPAENDP